MVQDSTWIPTALIALQALGILLDSFFAAVVNMGSNRMNHSLISNGSNCIRQDFLSHVLNPLASSIGFNNILSLDVWSFLISAHGLLASSLKEISRKSDWDVLHWLSSHFGKLTLSLIELASISTVLAPSWERQNSCTQYSGKKFSDQ